MTHDRRRPTPPDSSSPPTPSTPNTGELDETIAYGSGQRETLGTSGPIPSAPTGQLPPRIGKYRILRKLGEGGMGIVYEAEQQDPRRRVALKVIRGGRFVDDAVIRMFRREAETLARLRHSNIAAIYESGHTDDGQHFFVMELVLGDTLDAYLAKRSSDMNADEVRFRLALFRRIAEAVHYAHQRGVIHRDLKPSNIIVSDESAGDSSVATFAGVRLPDLKILDFGLARITEGDVNATQVTEVGTLKGTLPYMSPEQARGQAEAIDVRTDVYALGVILYEMLAGTRPYEVSHTSLIDAVRVICEEAPRSLRSSMSGSRRLDPDIETVVGKALEKDADRRYASAAAMSEDVERYLSSQPILARPPSTIYQIRKFTARNRALVAGIAATFIVLTAGVVVSTMQAVRAMRAEALATQRMARAKSAEAQALTQRREADEARAQAERRRAEADVQRGFAERERAIAADERQAALASGERAHMEATKAGAINRFLQDMLATADPWAGDAGKVTLDAALEQAQQRIGSWAGTDPDVDYAIRGTVATAFAGVGRYDEAEALLRGGLDRLRTGADAHPELVAALHRQLGGLMIQSSRYGSAEQELREALATQALAGSATGDTAALIMSQLAASVAYQGRYPLADSLTMRASEMAAGGGAETGRAGPEILRTRAYIANNWKEDFPAADLMLREAVAQLKARSEDRTVEASDALEELAGTHVRMGDLRGADSLYREAVALRRNVLGNDHPLVARSLENRGQFLYRTGQVDQTIEVLNQVLAIRQRGAGPESAPVGRTQISLAPVYMRAHRLKEADAAFASGIQILKARLGSRHPDLAPALKDYSELRVQQKRLNDAAALAREALSIRMDRLGPGSSGTIAYQVSLADILRANRLLSNYREAEALLLAARDAGIAARGAKDAGVIRATRSLVQLYEVWGKSAESRKWQAALTDQQGAVRVSGVP